VPSMPGFENLVGDVFLGSGLRPTTGRQVIQGSHIVGGQSWAGVEGSVLWKGRSYGRVGPMEGLVLWKGWSYGRVGPMEGLVLWKGWSYGRVGPMEGSYGRVVWKGRMEGSY